MSKRWIGVVVLIVAVWQGWQYQQGGRRRPTDTVQQEVSPAVMVDVPIAAATLLDRAIIEHRSHVPVNGTGVVVKILADDRDGSAHQRLLLRLHGGNTVLIAHNIDLASRVDDLRVGDELAFSGEYIWNEKGGLVHWTHHDPAHRHADGCHTRNPGAG